MSSEQPDGRRETPLRADRVGRGTSVLLAGPALTGKRRLLFDLVGGSGGAGILVTTKHDADRFRRDFLDAQADPADWDVRTVDCVSKGRNLRRVRDSAATKYVTSPGDLTGIGIAASGFMREFHHRDAAARLGLHSLSTLLMYADLNRVFQFVHVMTGRIEASEFVGVFSLDTTARSAESLDVLKGLFDALVEVREGDDRPELRVRGGDFGPRTWTPF